MRDGFFDVNYMEDWADEEERLHYRPEKNSRRKEAADPNSSEEEDEDEDERLERDEDEMDVLARLYDDDEGGDSEDEFNDLTAEEFFGKPDVKVREGDA